MGSRQHARKSVRSLFSGLVHDVTQRLFPKASSESTRDSKKTKKRMNFAHRWKELIKQRRRRSVTIDMLPDDVLLIIFHLYRIDDGYYSWPWHKLVQVCQKWRQLVFASSQRLDLQLVCSPRVDVGELLDVWPPMPIIIEYFHDSTSPPPVPRGWTNIVTALQHPGRVSSVSLVNLRGFLFDGLATAMQEPFPVLTFLRLHSYPDMAQALPHMFLGGFAPGLQYLWLNGVPSPALPKLLLSTANLLTLRLQRIPDTGYISPEAMARCLSTLINLRELFIEFQSPNSRPGRTRRLHLPSKCVVLPALTQFWFRGVSEYLEDLVAQIDAPVLERTHILFFNQLLFDVPQLCQFISRAEALMPLQRAVVVFDNRFVTITFHPPEWENDSRNLELRISSRETDWQLSSITQICGHISSLVSSVEWLYVCEGYSQPPLEEVRDHIDPIQWIEFFQPFTRVETLHLSKKPELLVTPVLQGLSEESAAAVLPAMRNLSVEGPRPSGSMQEAMKPFLDARRFSDRHVTLQCFDSKWDRPPSWFE
ncbi:hypothetical protein BC826DRAFT_1012656 [Russula brevipes]|nr:hypothetical protein BC826DRAFT_1012656 [Russula brevipes]